MNKLIRLTENTLGSKHILVSFVLSPKDLSALQFDTHQGLLGGTEIDYSKHINVGNLEGR